MPNVLDFIQKLRCPQLEGVPSARVVSESDLPHNLVM